MLNIFNTYSVRMIDPIDNRYHIQNIFPTLCWAGAVAREHPHATEGDKLFEFPVSPSYAAVTPISEPSFQVTWYTARGPRGAGQSRGKAVGTLF